MSFPAPGPMASTLYHSLTWRFIDSHRASSSGGAAIERAGGATAPGPTGWSGGRWWRRHYAMKRRGITEIWWVGWGI